MKRYHPNIINKEGTSDVHLSYPFEEKFRCPLCQKHQFHGFKRHSRTMHPNHTFNLIISRSVCKLEFSNPRVASNHFTKHKGSHKRRDAPKANALKTLLNYEDNNEESNIVINNNDDGRGCQICHVNILWQIYITSQLIYQIPPLLNYQNLYYLSQ